MWLTKGVCICIYTTYMNTTFAALQSLQMLLCCVSNGKANAVCVDVYSTSAAAPQPHNIVVQHQ